MQFTITTESGAPTANLEFSIEVPDAAAREYTTVVTAGIAAVVAKAGAILINAENEGNMSQALEDGMAMVNRIGC